MWSALSRLATKPQAAHTRARGFRLGVEALEGRDCPSGGRFEWADPTGGALDPTFGSGGVVLSSFSGYIDRAEAVTTQADGKVVVAAYTRLSGGYGDFLVARYNANGTLDTGFGNGGYTATDFNHRNDIAHSVTVLGNGKILVAGYVSTTAGGYDFGLARYNANGTLDTTFGSKGKVETDLGGNETVRSMAVDSAGRILVAGAGGTAWGLAIVRYTASGALDTTFGNKGKLFTNIPTYGGGLALQADGKIVVAGNQLDPAVGNQEFVVARFNSNGTADTTFGSGGVVTNHLGVIDGFGGLAIQSDGKIVVAGNQGGIDPDGVDRQGYYILRYNPNGTLDSDFGTGGVDYLVNPSGVLGQWVAGVAVQSDGSIVVGGAVWDPVSGQRDFAALRVSPTGALDAGFGDSGWAMVQYGSGDDVTAFALQPDGRVLLAGPAQPVANQYPVDLALVRFLTSAPQIGSFAATPNPITSGNSTTLTASNITDNNPGATVAQVAFYLMTGTSGTLLGYGTHNPDGSWSYAFDTTGYAPGTYTLAAQATDSYGALGNPVALSLTIE